MNDITFCNRSLSRVEQIAQKEEVALLPWFRLSEWPTYDLAIFGTKAPHFLITPPKHSPQGERLIIDLSVPRNVDPRVGRSPQITLLNVDQLNRAIDRKRRLKASEIARIEMQVIAGSVDRQVSIFREKEHSRLQNLLLRAS